MSPKPQLPIELKLKESSLIVPTAPLEKIADAVDSRRGVIVITGSVGIGKTTVLAHSVSALLEKGYDFLLIRGKAEPEMVLKEILLKVRDQGNPEAEQVFLSAAPYESKWSWVERHFLESGKLVAILDNFEENLSVEGEFISPQLKVLITGLQQTLKGKPSLFLLASTLDVEGLDTIELDELSLEQFTEGLARLEHLSAMAGGAVRELYGEIGGNPLVMKLLNSIGWLGRESGDGAGYSWDDVKKAIPGLKLAVARKRRRSDEVLRLFTQWILTRLESGRRSLLRALSAYHFPIGWSALAAHGIESLDDLKDTNWAEGWLEYDPELERFSLHPAIAGIVLEEMDSEERRALHRICGDFFSNLKDRQGNKSMDDILEARRHFMLAGAWDSAAEATFALGDYLDRIGFLDYSFRLLIEIHEKDLNPSNRAASDYAMGNVLVRYGRLVEARESFTRALKIWEKEDAQGNLPLALQQIGYTHSLEKSYDQALRFYNNALERLGASPDENERSRLLHQIALIHKSRGENREALELFRQSVEVMEKTGDESGVAASYLQMGQIYHSQGEWEAAIDHLEHSLDICLGMKDEAGVGVRHYFLGQAYETGNVPIKALREYLESWKVFSRLAAAETGEVKQRIMAIKDKLSEQDFANVVSESQCDFEEFDTQRSEQQDFLDFIHQMTQYAVFFPQLPDAEKERTVDLLNNMIHTTDYEAAGMGAFKVYFQMLLAYIYHEDFQRFRPLIPADLWALFQRIRAGNG